LALLAGVNQAAGQFPAQGGFFRIAGPTATTIIAFNPDGTLVWSGATPGATYTVQTATSLAGGGNWVDYVQLPASNSINTNLIVAFNPLSGMALIPAGTFTMGDTLDGENDAIPTNVYVSSFYMDVNLVSYRQWQSVYSYSTNNGYSFDHVGSAKDNAANQPVQTVDWYDCVKWCNARSQQAGLTPVYYTDTNLTQIYTNGNVDAVFVNWSANGYRLPTEAEWEKAARGGLSGQRFPWGDTISESQANYYGDTNAYSYDLGPNGYNSIGLLGGSPYTSPVGSFAPNGYGLYDMAGNVLEWCWDWYAAPPYPAGSPYLGGTDPRGPVGPLSYRVLRGGDWGYYVNLTPCANRGYGFNFSNASATVGFRCVRGL
jgi:formylglycine-generating enzyme required for sulfatase activity